MECWNCKWYNYQDYKINDSGKEEPYGLCENKKSNDYNEKVLENYSCYEFESKLL